MTTVLELSTTGKERTLWISLLDQLPKESLDLHYHPDYMRIYEMTYGDRTVLVVHKQSHGTVIQPFVVRRISDNCRYDVTSVYGYGGPLATGKVDAEAFQDALATWFAENALVSEYCLFSPFTTRAQSELLAGQTPKLYRKDVVVADLSQDVHTLWGNIEERQRKACAVARRKGVVTEYSPMTNADFADFQSRYLATMERVDASAFWKFPDDYFQNCRDALGRDNVTLLHAVHEGRRIATFFHIHMYDKVYYHFACADPEYRNLNPTSLLLFDSLIWAKSEGFRWFHMGGGRTTGKDSLYTFKFSFCGSALPLYGYNRVIDAEAYDALVAARENAEPGGIIPADFFPRYRS